MGTLKARVGSAWVPVGGSGDEVFIGPDDPAPANAMIELWYDTDAVGAGGTPSPLGGNMFKNPGFLVQQIGPSSGGGYGPDCWRADFTGPVLFMDYPALTDYGNTAPGQLGGQRVFRATCTTAKVLAAGEFAQFNTRFESIDVLRLGYGRANPQSLTVSFFAKSSTIGNYAIELLCGTPWPARLISTTYAINVADAWEYKVVTFPGDAATLLAADNQLGFQVSWWFAAGTNFTSGAAAPSWVPFDNARRAVGQSVSVVATVNNNFTIALPVLNMGTAPLPWVPRDYLPDLQVAQRYFVRYTGANNMFPSIGVGFQNGTTTNSKIILPHPVRMRATPAVGTIANLRLHTPGTAQDVTNVVVLPNESNDLVSALQITHNAVGTTNAPAILQGDGSGVPIFDLDARL